MRQTIIFPCLTLAFTFCLLAYVNPVLGDSPSQPKSLGDGLENGLNRQTPNPSQNQVQPNLNLPRVPLEPEQAPLSKQLQFYCREIRFVGNKAVSTDELQNLVRSYLNQNIDSLKLHELRQKLTQYYVGLGYINSGALIPDQRIVNGSIEIRIIEGRLENIELEGNQSITDRYLLDRITLEADDPLKISRLQENLQLLLENPLVERINADLKPGSSPGLALLKTSIKEKKPYQIGTSFDNQIAPSIGGYQGTVYALHRNLTGHADTFSAQGRFAEGLTGYGLDYRIPITVKDTNLHTWYTHYDSNLVETPFNQIDVTSQSESFGINLSHPLIHSPSQSLLGSLTLERRRSRTFLLGQPFSFSPGVQNGLSSVSVLRVGQEWVQHSVDEVLALRSTFNIGIAFLDATVNSNLPDSRFFSWLGQVQWANRIDNAQLIWRSDIQLTPDPLLPIEKFQIGGANSVRGYRENQLVRDWGFSSTLELRYPVLSEFFGNEKFFIAPFADVGGAWDVNANTSAGTTDILASVGLGIIWEPRRNLHSQLYWGKSLLSVNNPNQDPQDYGFHYKLSGQLF